MLANENDKSNLRNICHLFTKNKNRCKIFIDTKNNNNKN